MADNKDIRYLNRDFSELKTALVEFSKTYYPNTYTDFSPTSPGMMFMEMSAYVGDVLSFYLDNQFQENFLQYARQLDNVYSLAYLLGYKPKVTSVSIVDVDVYQQLPAVLSGTTYIPDFTYAVKVPSNLSIGSNSVNAVDFLIQDSIDFNFSSSSDPTEISVYQTTGITPTFFLAKKTRQAISSTIRSTTFSFGTPQQFPTVDISDTDIIKILDITDSDGNIWYEVPYLAQEMILDSIKNTNVNDPNFTNDSGDVPYLLRLRKIQRRFITRFTSPTNLQIQFGSGTSPYNNDEEIVPNPDNVGLGLPYKRSLLQTAFAPANFLYTDTYGIAPYNTTLTVRYLTGGGIKSNINANSLNQINNKSSIVFNNSSLDPILSQYVFSSVIATNPRAASGGQNGDTIEEIRLNALATFPTQLRSITADDYLIRSLSLPPEYGTISKAYIEPEKLSKVLPGESLSVLDLYVLTYDINNNLTAASSALKQNLKTYLSQYRTINDSIKIRDAYIINIGINFDLIVLPDYNNSEVIANCITTLQDYFNISKWQINQPIILKNLYILLDSISGVQTVKNIEIINKYGVELGYSTYKYDISGATRNNVVYPSIDPMVFELKYPNVDIQGRVVPL